MFRFAIALFTAVASSRRTDENQLTVEPEECQAVDSTKAYFDGLRDKYQIQECTKRDVCLLMRQLDAYFYTRARQGKLVTYDSPPQRSWVYDGRCEKNARSIKMAPITKLPACKAAVRAKGIQKVKVVNSTNLPTGCSIKTQRTSKAYLNQLETKVEAGMSYEQGKHWSQTNKKEIAQYCEVDHSLSEAAASYYSPYKLKESMKAKPEKSASCSFGMMANLSKLELTASPCAEILSFRPQHTASYGGAAAALKAADKLQAQGKEEEADDIRTEVQNIRSKFVLIQLITTDWCPSIWKEAMSNYGYGSTCSAPRFPSWAQNDFDHDFGIGDGIQSGVPGSGHRRRDEGGTHGVPHAKDGPCRGHLRRHLGCGLGRYPRRCVGRNPTRLLRQGHCLGRQAVALDSSAESALPQTLQQGEGGVFNRRLCHLSAEQLPY